MSREEQGGNGEKRLGSWIFRSINLLLNAAVLVVLSYTSMWMSKSFPSKADFKELQVQVNSLDRAVLQLSETNKRIEDFEQRIRALEKGDNRRFPPPRP